MSEHSIPECPSLIEAPLTREQINILWSQINADAGQSRSAHHCRTAGPQKTNRPFAGQTLCTLQIPVSIHRRLFDVPGCAQKKKKKKLIKWKFGAFPLPPPGKNRNCGSRVSGLKEHLTTCVFLLPILLTVLCKGLFPCHTKLMRRKKKCSRRPHTLGRFLTGSLACKKIPFYCVVCSTPEIMEVL